jgi:hypothetical protein
MKMLATPPSQLLLTTRRLPPRLINFTTPSALCVDCAGDNHSISRLDNRVHRFYVRGNDSCPSNFPSRKQPPQPPIWSSKSPSRIVVILIIRGSRQGQFMVGPDANNATASPLRRYVSRTNQPPHPSVMAGYEGKY